jgi:hypothetical protein
MSDGQVTLEVAADFEHHAKIFFLNIKGGISKDEKVTRILGGFSDSLIRDWVACNGHTLAALSFNKFMKTFCEEWLQTDWEETTRQDIVASQLDPAKEKFETWVTRIHKLNVTL